MENERNESDFVITISDGFVAYEFGFNGVDFCIQDFVNAISNGLNIKQEYSKQVTHWPTFTPLTPPNE